MSLKRFEELLKTAKGAKDLTAKQEKRIAAIEAGKGGKSFKQALQEVQGTEKAKGAKVHSKVASLIEGLKKIAQESKKPKKVIDIADALRRDDPKMSDEVAYRIAWEQYCSKINPSYEGCGPKGKSMRKSPKSEYAAKQTK